MRKSFFLLSLITFLCINTLSAQEQTSSKAWEENAIIAYFSDNGWEQPSVENSFMYRKLLRKLPDGKYEIQDFYSDTDQKRNEPFTVTKEFVMDPFEDDFTGLFTSYYPNGKKEEELYLTDGMKDGEYKKWYENGQLHSQITYKGGLPEGETANWYDNGQKFAEITYVNGQKEGKGFQWYSNGVLAIESNYKNNLLDGPLLTYYPSENIKIETTFQHGTINGNYTAWYDNGKKGIEAEFASDKLIAIKNLRSEKGERVPANREIQEFFMKKIFEPEVLLNYISNY